MFAAVLFASSYKILSPGGDEEEEEDLENNMVVRTAKRFLQTTDQFDGEKFFTVSAQGQSLATPLFLCLVCIELSDVVFAFDSVSKYIINILIQIFRSFASLVYHLFD